MEEGASDKKMSRLKIMTRKKNLDAYTTFSLTRWRMMFVIKITTGMGGGKGEKI